MGRLIDADALISFIDAGHLRHPGELCFSEVDVVNMLNHAPTAYDVEKVVAELEEQSHWSEPTFDEDGYCNDDSFEVVYLDKAIDIVKAGGVE